MKTIISIRAKVAHMSKDDEVPTVPASNQMQKARELTKGRTKLDLAHMIINERARAAFLQQRLTEVRAALRSVKEKAQQPDSWISRIINRRKRKVL
ncbi:MAG: hypothetical protein Q8L60_10420 [Gammaproteobacteria bacterium]|nr:hypothetical protein [Gammaproteobacteria bacterium]MDP2346763.1 hypothetical protein [Gammaproteobacteria bacterium]